MKMYSKDEVEMMDITSVRRQGSDLIVKGKVMGAMTMSIYVRPSDVWESKSLLSWSVIWYLPIMILKGFWSSLFKEKKQ